ncbi:hypothetical protein C8R46DRAFT_1030648 [Mycena filopes]|nr:hypothetical protein C8R46DRAFT_1030648 [Mycena filopes]
MNHTVDDAMPNLPSSPNSIVAFGVSTTPSGSATSAPPSDHAASPPPTGAAKTFLDCAGQNDKRGKLDTRQTQRDMDALAQQSGRVYKDLRKHRAETTQVLECAQSYHFGVDFGTNTAVDLSAQIESLQQPNKNLQAVIACNARDISTANDRLEQLELVATTTAATVGTINSAVKTLIARLNAGPAPAPTPTQLPVPAVAPAPIVNDEPIEFASNTLDSHTSLMETLLQQLVAKRGRSPDPFDDERNIRTRLADPGPVSWGRNITGESSIVIKAVLPTARSVNVDQTPTPCFESAEIAKWVIAAFNAARVAPYESVFASPNV